MTTTKKKTGRKQKHHTGPDGTPVIGLSRRPSDGRWRVIGTNITFTEPDERRAIAKFHRLRSGEVPECWLHFPSQRRVPAYDFNAPLSNENPVNEFSAEEIWTWVAEQIREKPKHVAAMTGIEEIGYLSNLKAPPPLPTVAELEATWLMHADCSELQRKKVARAWSDFVETTRVKTLGDICSEAAVAFKDAVKSRGLSKKQQQHLFTGIRRVVSFAIERSIAVEAANRALAFLKCLKTARGAVSLDPKPIEVADWQKLYAAAEADDRAMLLLMLNGAFYIQEVIDLEWDDIRNGCIVTNREKTGKCIRVCVLWPETLAALERVQQQGDKIFYTYQAAPIKVCGAQRRFRRLAIKAGLATTDANGDQQPTVTASQLRDSALTAAAEANVNSQLCKLLAGHRSGMDDHYVKRNPKMVAPACAAVFSKYMNTSAVDCQAA